MKLLWRSVVGKVWATILLLVAVVLIILTLLLVQFFDHFYFEEQRELMLDLGQKNCRHICNL